MAKPCLRKVSIVLLFVTLFAIALPSSIALAAEVLYDVTEADELFEQRMDQWRKEAKDVWDSYVIDWPDDKYVIDEENDGLAGVGYRDDLVMAFLRCDVSPQDAKDALARLSCVSLSEAAAESITEYSIAHQFVVTLDVVGGASIQDALDELWDCGVVEYASPSHIAQMNGYATRGDTNEETYLTYEDLIGAEEMERLFRTGEIGQYSWQRFVYENSIAVYPCKKQVIPNELIPGVHYVANEVIVIPEGRATPEEFTAALDAMKTIELSDKERSKIDEKLIANGGTILATVVKGHSVQDAIDELWECELVAYVGSNKLTTLGIMMRESISLPSDMEYELTAAANDPSIQSWLTAVDAQNAWDIAQCNYGVSVAVLDSGFNTSHEDLYGVLDLAHAFNALDGTDDVSPLSFNDPYIAGHGSRVAGIIAAQANNNVGIAGISHNARIVPVKVLSDDGSVSESTIVAAYNYLLSQIVEDDLNLRVINMSFGNVGEIWPALGQHVARANSMGVVSVCAAGNAGEIEAVYDSVAQETMAQAPANIEGCITVAAVTNQGEHASFSSFNGDVDIAAPGVDMLSASTGGISSYLADSGTSFSAPMVSGAAALLYAHNPLYTVDDVRDILCTTARDLEGSFSAPDGSTVNYGAGWDKVTGHGMLDVAAALEEAFDRDGATEWERAYGTTRYDTAAAVSAATFDSADCVVIASGVNYPDALSAASLAGGASAPILTAPSAGLLPDSEVTEIQRLGATRAIIVGGPLIVSDAIKVQLEGIVGSGNVVRVYGTDRIGTSIAVAQELGSSHSNTVIVANGFSFADALSIGYYAYASKSPVFLTNSDGTLSASVVSAINSVNYPNVVIVGGALAVKDSVKTQLAATGRKFYRISGANRYETNTNVARWATGALTDAMVQPCVPIGISTMYLATGSGFEDSLGSSAAAGYGGGVLIMCEDSTTGRYATTTYVQPRHHLIQNGVIVGGTLAVPSSVVRDFMACAA